jgi:hypothetical protein
MKRLNKISIISDKIIKPDELIILKGGGTCYCTGCSNYGEYIGAGSPSECSAACFEINCGSFWDWWG